MASKIPTSLGSPVIPQAGRAGRVAYLDTAGLGNDLVGGARIASGAWHQTAAGLQEVGKAFDYLQSEQDKKEAKDWLNQIIKDKTTIMYGDGTAENPGYMNLQGDAAVKARKAASDNLNKLKETYLSKASNKQVAKLVDMGAMELIAPDQEDILKHASKENIVAMNTTDLATVSTATDLLSANPTSGQVEKQATTLIIGSVNAILDREGITDPVARNARITEALSKSKASAIRTALVRDPKAGSELYAKWKDQIQGTDQAVIETDIIQAEDRQMRKQEHQIYMDRQAKQIAANEAQAEYARGIMLHAADPNKYPDVPLEKIASDPRLEGPDIYTLYNMQQAADKDNTPAAESSRNLSDIIMRIMAPYGNPNKISTYKEINDMMANNKLTKADWNFARQLIDQGATEDGAKLQPSMGAAIKASERVVGKPDAAGLFPDERHAIMQQQFNQYVFDQVERYKKENKNPYDLFNPEKPDYVLAPGVLNRFKIPLEDSIQYGIQNMQSGGDNIPLPPAPSSQLDLPVFANKTDPAYINLPQNSEYYRLDPATGQVVTDSFGRPLKYRKGGGSVPMEQDKATAPVTAPTGQ